jgi:hypothetical protein
MTGHRPAQPRSGSLVEASTNVLLGYLLALPGRQVKRIESNDSALFAPSGSSQDSAGRSVRAPVGKGRCSSSRKPGTSASYPALRTAARKRSRGAAAASRAGG